MMKLKLLLLLVLVAGCLEDGGGDAYQRKAVVESGYGLKIFEFAPDFSEVYTGDTLSIYMTVQNLGDAPAQTASASLTYLQGVFIIDDDVQDFNDLLEPPELIVNIPGDRDMVTWDIETTDYLDGDYTFTSKLTYWYSSEASSDLLVITRQRYKEMQDIGIENVVTTHSSTAPVFAYVDVLNSYVLLNQDNERSFKVGISLENIGKDLYDGQVYSPKVGDCNIDLGCIDRLTIFIPRVEEFKNPTCDGAEPVRNTTDEQVFEIRGIQMNNDELATVFCDIDVQLAPDIDPSFERTYLIRAVADYRYKSEASTIVTVIPSD